MGGKPAANTGATGAKRAIDCPRGVTLRTFRHEARIQIAFSFKGVECRELLPPQKITQTAVNLAAGLRQEVLNRIERQTFVYSDYFPDSPRARQFGPAGVRITVDKALQAQEEAFEKQQAKGNLSPSTVAGYRKAIHSERMAHWKGWPLASVKPSDIRAWLATFDCTAKFTRNLLTPLRAAFEDALNDDQIEFNPFDRIAMTKLLKKTSLPSEYEIDPFDAAERAQLLARARPDEQNMVRFWFNTGLRPGELIALRWPKIDWVNSKARIDVNQVERQEKGPKTEAGVRDIDLNADALAALTAQKAVSFLAGEHIWLNPRTGQAWGTDAQIRKTLWQPLCTRAGVRYRNPYQVRHTFASAALTAGQNPFYMADQLGHADVRMVFKVYGKFISQDFQKPKAQALRLVGSEG